MVYIKIQSQDEKIAYQVEDWPFIFEFSSRYKKKTNLLLNY